MANVPEQLPGTYGTLRGQIYQSSEFTLTPPINIIQTINAARGLYYRYRTQHLKRIELYASIKGLIAGNPPYDPIELYQNGLSFIANFNNGDASALYEQGGLAYWNLLNQAEVIAKFIFHDDSDPQLLNFATIMARKWNDTVRKWTNFERQVCTLSGQILKFGYSPAVWSDERDWKWQTVPVERFFVSDQASTDTDLLTTIFVESIFTVQQLYEIYTTFKDKPKEEHPWNTDQLAAFLIDRANTYQKFTQPIITAMDLQNRIENGDISFDLIYTDEVRLVSLLQKEYDGKFSHYIFDRVWEGGPVPPGANVFGKGFLYFSDRQFSSLQEFLVLFTASPDAFTIHDNRGLGHRIFATCQATMQLDCDIVNMARLSSTPIVRSPNVGARDFEAIQFKPGVPTNIGTAEFVQNQLGSNIEQLVFAGGYMLQKLQANIAHAGKDASSPDRSQGSISPSEARSRDFKEFGVLKNNIAHFYKSFDLVAQNMVIKMLNSKPGWPGYKEANEWKEKCIAAGVPELLFDLNKDGTPKYFEVKATRVAGDGSNLALIMGLETLGPIVPSLGANGLRQYQKDMVMATMGLEYVAAYVGEEEPDETAGGASLAGVENAIMQMGKSPVFSPDNEQRSHIVTHFELGKLLIQQRQQQQMGAREADAVFTVLLPHLGEHINFIAQNPLQQTFFEGIKKAWEQISEYGRLNRKNAEAELQAEIRKQQELQAENQRVLSEEELKNLQVTNDEKRKDFKVMSTVERAKEANETRAQILKEKTYLDADNQNLKIRLEAQNKSTQTQEKSLPALRQELSNMNGVTPAPADIE